jgi:hypothetical protein
MYIWVYILPRVRGIVYNINGFWIEWMRLLTAYFTITRNRNQLQELTINLQPNPSSLTDEDSIHSRSRSMTPSNWTTLTLISSRHGPRTENTARLLLHLCVLEFPRDRYPASPLARWLLPSNGLGAKHIENIAPVFLAKCLFERVYLATGFSGSMA